MTGRLQSIPLDAILANTRLQNRNTNSPCVQHRLPLTPATLEHLESLRAAIKRGEYLPPISIVKAENDKPGQFYLVDGFHRWWAHRDCNQETIEATILEGQGFIDALVASGGVNLKHGLRLEEDQKIENAWRCLNLPTNEPRGSSSRFGSQRRDHQADAPEDKAVGSRAGRDGPGTKG